MGIVRSITRAIRLAFAAPRSAPVREEPNREAEPLTLRRWESARTTRLNRAHWQHATGQTINADLAADLETLRTRVTYEIANNPTLDGVIKTLSIDVAGDNGPTLQVKSSNPAYNKALEKHWKDVARNIDVRGRQALVDFLGLWVKNLFRCGEFIAQKVTDSSATTPVKLRLKGIDPRRLGTPGQLTGDPDVCLGVRQDANGKAVTYYIARPLRMGAFDLLGMAYDAVPAANILHEFIVTEDDQARGVPWMSVNLDSCADLRDYDAQVLDAARQAADWAVSLYTEHPDAEYIEVNESTDIERRSMSTCPPGWKPYTVTPPQPHISYVDYRTERQRDLGQPCGMPGMLIRKDSAKHSYSSARFDSQPYQRGVSSLQSWLERRTLNPLLADVQKEAQFIDLPSAPADLTISWIWPKPKHVDEEKEAQGENIRLRNRTLPWSQIVIEGGDDPDVVEQQLIEDEARFERIGGVPPWVDPKVAAAESAAAAAKKQAEASGKKAKENKPMGGE